MNLIKITKQIIPLISIFIVFTPHETVYPEENSPFPIEQIVIYGDGSAGPYSVDRRFIGGTSVADTLLNVDLSVETWDDQEGTVIFNRSIAAGDSVMLTIAVPPPWIKTTYRRSESEYLYQPGISIPYRSNREKIPKSFPGLRFGGSKTFDVSTGTDHEVALNQTLRLNIAGNLTDDITLNATISDQNIPITPEGDTSELNELDRILIELRGPGFTVDMGDTDLKMERGRWLNYSRRLSGAHASVTTKGFRLFGSGAVSDGRYMSITISPVEGNQGPYRLTAEHGRTDISIIPGTERLWINGERLTRGANNDYTMDYETGEVTFSENRIIGSDMRIVCDYEYTSDSFRRTFYSAGTEASFWDGRLTLDMVTARESDDPDRPVLVDLDKATRSILSKSGDSPEPLPGWRPAEGDTTGTYDFIDSHFVYNPQRKGAYNVTFSWIGENEGEYRYKGGGIYEYVPEEERGPGSGASYRDVVILQSPVSHSIAGLHMSFDPVSAVHLETEVMGTSVDKNILSPIDDSDNSDGAYRLGIGLSPIVNAGLPIQINFTGNHRSQGHDFAPLDRDRDAEENRRWGLPLVLQSDREIVSEYAGGLFIGSGKFNGSGIEFNGGRAEFGESATSNRTGIKTNFKTNKRGTAYFKVDNIVRENLHEFPDETIRRLYAEATFIVAGFTPSLVFDGERMEGRGDFSHGSAYSELRTRLENREVYGMKSGVEWFYRAERTKRSTWADSSTARGGSLELSAGKGVTGMMRTRYSRRERIGGSHHATTDLAMIEGSYRPAGAAINIDISYRAGRTREASKRKNFIYTGGDRGSFRWEDYNNDSVRDPDEFIPDEHGSYYLYEETLDDYLPVNVVRAYSKLGLNVPSTWLSALTGYAVTVQTETSFEVNEKSSAPSSDVFLLKLSDFRKKDTTMSGDIRFQEDITFPVADDGSVRLRFYHTNIYEAEYVTGAERRGEEEQSLRLRLPVTEDSDAELTLKHALYRRNMENITSGDYHVKSLSGDAELSVYPIPAIKAGFNLGGGYDRDSISTITARYYILKPSAAYHFSGKGKIETSYTITSVTLRNSREGARLPYTMARGRKEGNNHDVSVICDYRLSHRMNLIVSYTGRQFADRDFEHFARAQLRAMF